MGNSGFRHIAGTAIFIGYLVWLGASASASELVFSSSVGYSSNPALEAEHFEQSGGSPFTSHTLMFDHEFDISDLFTIEVSPSATFQNMWKLPDNHQFNLDLTITPNLSWKRITPYLFANAYIYRDAMLKPDERDEFSIGAGAEMILSGRYTLALEHGWQRISYLEDSPIFYHAGRGVTDMPLAPVDYFSDGSGDFSDAVTPEDPLEQYYNARDDIDMFLKARLDIFLLPALTASAGLKYEYWNSSLDAESFWQLTPDIKVLWDFADRWRFTISGQVEARRYFDIKNAFSETAEDTSSADSDSETPASYTGDITSIRELNYTTSFDLRLSYFLDSVELFTDFFMERGEYPLNDEYYKQQVVQCGFSWSF